MPTLADLIAPMTVEQFVGDYYLRRPLHLPSRDASPFLANWEEVRRFLNVKAHWTPALLKLVRDGDIVDEEHYCDPFESVDGRKLIADPAKVNVFLSMGATLIANEVQWLSPTINELAADLETALVGDVGANAYCSFPGRQGFSTHFDLHEVFVVQCEGEKLWRIYENRADEPTSYPKGTIEEVHALFAKMRGRVAAEILMRPGDVLYLPRGLYHDALAQGQASLHITFSIFPAGAELLFRLLRTAALQEGLFRKYLPVGDRAALKQHLMRTGERLLQIVQQDDFADAIDAARAKRTKKPFSIPHAEPISAYEVTNAPRRLESNAAGSVLFVGQAAIPLKGVEDLVAWILGRNLIVLEEAIAKFTAIPEANVRDVVRRLVDAQLLRKVSL